MRRCRLNGSDGQHCRSEERRVGREGLCRCLRFTVSQDSENEALPCGRPVSTCHVSPARIKLTATPTWTGPGTTIAPYLHCNRNADARTFIDAEHPSQLSRG